jgi:hypothetical protein
MEPAQDQRELVSGDEADGGGVGQSSH